MSKRILIVEDEESIADLEKDYLELSGFEVEVANDGEVGLKKGLEGEFDLIILDLMLPGVAQTKIKGMLNDSFSIDEYEGNLRLVTTIDEIYSNNDIMPLNETADETADKNGTTDKSDASKVTEKAVEAAKNMLEVHNECKEVVMRYVTDEEKELMNQIMQKMLRSLDEELQK